MWIRTNITKFIIPQRPATTRTRLEERRYLKRYLRDRGDICVAVVEATTTKHIDNLGSAREKRKMSRGIAEMSDGIRITPLYPTSTFLKRVMRKAIRYGNNFIPHHIHSRGYETKIKRAIHCGDHVRKDERFKMFGLAISEPHLELWLLDMFKRIYDMLGTVCV